MAKPQLLSAQTETGGVHSFSVEERRSFAERINEMLSDDASLKGALPMDPNSNALFDVISHGLLLPRLVNKVEPNTVPENKIPKKAQLNAFELSGVHQAALEGATKIGCHIVNVGAEDLTKAVPHLILGVVWQIIRIDLLKQVKAKMDQMGAKMLAPGEDPSQYLNITPEQNLLRWFNYHLRRSGSTRQVSNFGPDIRDSECYILLLSQIAPTVCTRDGIADPDLLRRANFMLDQAAKLNCRKFVHPEDVVAGNPKLNLAFTAYLFAQNPGLQDVDAAERADAEAARRAAEAAAAAAAAAEAARRAAEEEARRKAEEEARRKAEEEARRLAAEEEARRKAAADAEAARLQMEQMRLAQEEEGRRKAAWDQYYAQQAAAQQQARAMPPPQPVRPPPGPGVQWRVAFKNAAQQNFLRTDTKGNIICDRNPDVQAFFIEWETPTTAFIRSQSGYFVSARSILGVARSVSCDRVERASWERWTVFFTPQGTVTFEGAHHKWLASDKKGELYQNGHPEFDCNWELIDK